MPADHGELMGHATVGDGDSGGARHADGAGDAGDDRARDAVFGQRPDLFHAAAEDERVAALESHDSLARLGVLDESVVDGLLGHEAAVRDLRRVDDLDVRGQLVEEVAGGPGGRR
ncbi:hypothetical protein GCM10020000_66030 [Streptomyces olivoverticillatus]